MVTQRNFFRYLYKLIVYIYKDVLIDDLNRLEESAIFTYCNKHYKLKPRLSFKKKLILKSYTSFLLFFNYFFNQL